jgi:hypothetical protein
MLLSAVSSLLQGAPGSSYLSQLLYLDILYTEEQPGDIEAVNQR